MATPPRRTTRSSIAALASAPQTPALAPIPCGPGAIFNLIRCRSYPEIMKTLKSGPWNIHETISATTPRWGNQNIIFSCVMRAADKGDHLSLLKYFHNADVPMNLKDVNGQSALFYACKNGLSDCAEYLLVFGDNDPSDRDIFGETAIFYAVRSGQKEVIQLMLKNGASIATVQNGSKNSLLHESVNAVCFQFNMPRDPICLDFDVIQILLDYACDVNQKNALGETPLFSAVRAENQPLVDMLMGAYGADTLLRNNQNRSVISYCTEDTELFDMLVENREAKKWSWSMGEHKRTFEEAFGDADVPMTKQEAEAAVLVTKKAKKATIPIPQHAQSAPQAAKPQTVKPQAVKTLIAKPQAGKVAKPKVKKPAKKGKKSQPDEVEEIIPEIEEEVEEVGFYGGDGQNLPVQDGNFRSFFEMVEHAPLEEVRRVINADFDCLHMDPAQGTLVHAAARRKVDALPVIQYLVELGVPPNFGDFCGWSPLFHAISKNNCDCIKYLAEKKCHLHYTDTGDLTPLMHAVEQGLLEAVSILYSLGCKTNVKRDISGENLTHIAASKGFADILSFLLHKDVDGRSHAFDYDIQGNTPIHIAKTDTCVNLLLEFNVSVQQMDRSGVPAIFSHIRHGRNVCVETLLAKDCSPEVTDIEGKTCLIAAAAANRPKLCSLLLTHNAKMSATDLQGNSAESIAGKHQFTEICRIFKAENDRIQAVQDMQDQNNTNLKNSVGSTNPIPQIRLWIDKYKANPHMLWDEKKENLLYTAVDRSVDVCDVIRFLIDEQGLNANYVDLTGETVLFKVARDPKYNIAIAELLLERQCDPLQASNESSESPGEIALFEAVRRNNYACIDLLLSKDLEKVSLKHVNRANENVLFLTQNMALLRRLIKGADPTLVTKNQRSLLFHVVDVETVKIILELNCDVSTVDITGNTCLFTAVTAPQSMELMELYVARDGANPAHVNLAGQTCLHIATENGCEEVSLMLTKDYDLDPFMKDSFGNCPMQTAEKKNMRKFVDFVTERKHKIEEVHKQREEASQELMDMLHIKTLSLDDVKTFGEERSPLFNFIELSRNKQSLLFKAVFQRDEKRTDEDACAISQYLVDQRADPTVRDTNSQTALYYACRYLGPKTCKFLIDNGCNVNDFDLLKGTPLSYAALSTQVNKIELVEFLLTEKADPDSVNVKNETEMEKAIFRDDFAMMKMLIKHGSVVNREEPSTKRTPLFTAAAWRGSEAVEILISSKADVNVTDAEGVTPLFVASKQNTALLLEAGAKALYETSDGRNALFFCKSALKIDLLLQAGLDLKKKDKLGKTCLFTAVEDSPPRAEAYRHFVDDLHMDPFELDKQERSCVDIAHLSGDRVDFLSMVEELKGRLREVEGILRNGTLQDLLDLKTTVALNHKDCITSRNFGFIVAGRSRDLPDTVEMLQKLQECHVDLTDLDAIGRTPFFNAAQSGNINAMQFLMVVQCNVGEVDKNQQTPLFAAARGGDVKSLRFLIDHYANKEARSEVLQETVLFEAVRSGNEEMVKAVLEFAKPKTDLNQCNVKNVTPLIEAMRHDKLSVIECIIDRGADVNDALESDGKTPLFHCQSAASCLALIEKKAEVNKTDNLGRTPLFDAVINLNLPVVDMLISCKAGVNVRDESGRTPIFYCVEEDEQNDVLQKLLDFGAKVEMRDKAHQTPITIAKTSNKRKNILSFLTSLRKKKVVVVKPSSASGEKKSNYIVKLTPKRAVDGRLQHCVVTFVDKEKPSNIVPYGSDEYKKMFWELKRDNRDLLGMLEYPAGTPWTTGV